MYANEMCKGIFNFFCHKGTCDGELAQMGERSLSMREVPGSIPGFSKVVVLIIFFFFVSYFASPDPRAFSKTKVLLSTTINVV